MWILVYFDSSNHEHRRRFNNLEAAEMRAEALFRQGFHGIEITNAARVRATY